MIPDNEIAKQAVIKGTTFEALKLELLNREIAKLGPHGCLKCDRTISANKRYCKSCLDEQIESKQLVRFK